METEFTTYHVFVDLCQVLKWLCSKLHFYVLLLQFDNNEIALCMFCWLQVKSSTCDQNNISVKQTRQYQYIKHITSVADHTHTNILYGQKIDVRYIFYNIVMHKVNNNMVVQNLTNTRLKC